MKDPAKRTAEEKTFINSMENIGDNMAKKPGLYANIHAKKKRIAAGSGEKMRKKGEKGAPAKGTFAKIAKQEKKKKSKKKTRKV